MIATLKMKDRLLFGKRSLRCRSERPRLTRVGIARGAATRDQSQAGQPTQGEQSDDARLGHLCESNVVHGDILSVARPSNPIPTEGEGLAEVSREVDSDRVVGGTVRPKTARPAGEHIRAVENAPMIIKRLSTRVVRVKIERANGNRCGEARSKHERVKFPRTGTVQLSRRPDRVDVVIPARDRGARAS